MTTIKDLLNWAKDRNPDEPVWYLIYSKDDVADHFGNSTNTQFQITDTEWEEVCNRMEFSDYTWEQISEDFGDACLAVDGLDKIHCQSCNELHREVIEVNNEKLCPSCGEEKEVV